MVAHNVRSALNVGSLLRTADGLGVRKVYLSGYTPYPRLPNDNRLPHLADKIDARISKTALGAERSVDWEHCKNIADLLTRLDSEGYDIAALEQSDTAIPLEDYRPAKKTALVVGSEVGGLPVEILKRAAVTLEIPMRGQKESFNVAVAAALALYRLSWVDK